MAKKGNSAELQDALHLLVSLVPDVLMSMLVDHGEECICHEAARVILPAAGIGVEQLCALWVDGLAL